MSDRRCSPLADTERRARGGLTGSERDGLLVKLVAAYAEGQVRYGRAVRLLSVRKKDPRLISGGFVSTGCRLVTPPAVVSAPPRR